MSKVQKKALQQASKILKSLETSTTYSAVSSALRKAEFDKGKIDDVLTVLITETTKDSKIVNEAKSWIDTVIEDLP